MAEARLKAIITADTGNLVKGFKKAEIGTKKLNKGFAKLVGTVQGLGAMRLATALGGLLVVRKFINLTKESVRLAGVQEKAEARLAAVMRQVNQATEEEIDSLKQYAAELQKVTTFGDEQTISAMAMLGTFQLNTEQIKEIIPRILDMGAAMEKTSGATVDLESITIAVGKAMTMGIGSLSRYGVVITDAQRKLFQLADASEKVVILTEALDANFKGIAEETGRTFAGQLERLGNDVGDLKEKLGFLVMEGLNPFVAALSTSITGIDDQGEAFEKLRGTMYDTANSLLFLTKTIVNSAQVAGRALKLAFIDIPLAGMKQTVKLFTLDFWRHPIKGFDMIAFEMSKVWDDAIDDIMENVDDFGAALGNFNRSAVSGFIRIRKEAKNLSTDFKDLGEAGKKAMEDLGKSAEKAVDKLKKIQDQERKNTIEFIKSQIERKQSFKERLSDMTVEAEARRMDINKEITDLERRNKLTEEEKVKLSELYEEIKKIAKEVEIGVRGLGVGALGALAPETLAMAGRGDIERMVAAFMAQQAEATVEMGARQEALVRERGVLGATFNFDFTGAIIADKDKLIQEIIDAVNRADALTTQGAM